jgi:hypothetical protein
VSGAQVTTGSTWNSRGDQEGDGGFIDVSALSNPGTVTTTSASHSWNTIGGAGGGFGGDVDVFTIGDISLTGDMDAGGNGEFASGGFITIDTDGDITVNSGSRIEADASGTDASDGTISLTACNMTVSGDIDTRNLDSGENDFDYAGMFTQNSGSVLLADDDGGNNFFCRCVDTSPADGVCDTPASCVNPPTLNGTVTPSATFFPLIRASCT